MIQTVDSFIAYFESIRRRTLTHIRTVPADRIDWTPKAGEFSCGEIVRHIAAAEAMFVGAVVEGVWRYAGHTGSGTNSLDDAIERLEAGHVTAMHLLRRLKDDDLTELRPTLDGPPVKVWRLLMALVEHEVHHRSQLAVYLALMGVEPPHIYGLGVEDVIARATG